MSMIKLIVTDMDNTLVLPDKSLPEAIVPLIWRLKENGIVFAAASARHFDILHKAFGEAADDMAYICDNGAYGEADGTVFASEPLTSEEIVRIVDICEEIPDVSLSLAARDRMIYPTGKIPPVRKQNPKSINHLYHHTACDDLRSVEVPIYRATLYDPADPLNHSLPLLKAAFGESMSITATDTVCVDIMKPGIDKGTGLAALQAHLGVTPEETMVFGDYFNDLPMLKRAYYSVAVANAHPDVKEQCRYTTASNADFGVLRTIEAVLDGHFAK